MINISSSNRGSILGNECFCGWKTCGSYQRTFRRKKHKVLNGVLEVEFRRDEKSSHVIKYAWDRHLRVERSKREAWKDSGKCVYVVARHHFTEPMLTEYFKDIQSWDWKIPLSEKEAKRLLWTLEEADSLKKKSSNEVGYLKVPNVPKDHIKQLVKDLKGGVDASAHSVDSFKASSHSVDSWLHSVHSKDSQDISANLGAPSLIQSPGTLETKLRAFPNQVESEDDTAMAIDNMTASIDLELEESSENKLIDNASCPQGEHEDDPSGEGSPNTGDREEIYQLQNTGNEVEAIEASTSSMADDECPRGKLDEQKHLEVRYLTEAESSLILVQTLQEQLSETRALLRKTEEDLKQQLKEEKEESTGGIAVEAGAVLKEELKKERHEHEQTKTKLEESELLFQEASQAIATVEGLRRSEHEYQATVNTLNQKMKASERGPESNNMEASATANKEGTSKDIATDRSLQVSNMSALHALLEEALTNMEKLEEENEIDTKLIADLRASIGSFERRERDLLSGKSATEEELKSALAINMVHADEQQRLSDIAAKHDAVIAFLKEELKTARDATSGQDIPLQNESLELKSKADKAQALMAASQNEVSALQQENDELRRTTCCETNTVT